MTDEFLFACQLGFTGKSLSEALLFAEHGENMLCTKIALNVRNNFCTQHVSDRPKQCFAVLPEPNRTSQSKFCFPNRNRTELNM